MVRLTPHSSDDDDSAYRSKEDKAALKISDPLPKFRGRLMDAGILSQQHERELDERIVDEVNHAHQTAEAAPYPSLEWAAGPVYAP